MSIINSEIFKKNSRIKKSMLTQIKGQRITFLRICLKQKRWKPQDILNLNKFVCYRYFKMDSIQSVLNVVKKNAFMASIDLKDAFYSAPGIRHHQKYLVFFANEYLKFTCMPNGYGHAMKIFTKITKVPFSVLNQARNQEFFRVGTFSWN